MDLLLGIGPPVSGIREELEDLKLALYISQRYDWREAHVYPDKIRRFTKLLIAAHRLLEREQRASLVAATDRAETSRAAAVEKTAALGAKSDTTKQEGTKQRPGKERKGDGTLLGEKLLDGTSRGRTGEELPTPGRLSGVVTCPLAARRMEAYMGFNGLKLTDFATQANTTDRTLRQFRKTGKVRQGIFDAIAEAMGTTRQALLKPE
jgi:hypothetical protein